MKKRMTLAAIAALIATTGLVHAHGDAAKHDGIVASSKEDIGFELVHQDGKTTLYVEDHGKPVATSGASGKLTVLNGTEKAEVALEPAGANTLVAKGPVRMDKGAKAIAAVTFADKRSVSVRFAVK